MRQRRNMELSWILLVCIACSGWWEVPWVVYAPNPTRKPTPAPSFAPTWKPGWPTPAPTDPTASPTFQPTATPTVAVGDPTPDPTESPTPYPTESPTESPTPDPTPGPGMPTFAPTEAPTTPDPTPDPTPGPGMPTIAPTVISGGPGSPDSPTTSPILNPTSPTKAPSLGGTSGPTASPTKEGASVFQQKEFFDGLPLYAKVLFTFAIISVSFAIMWFTYRKIVKPRLVLKQHLYSSHSDADSENADLTGARSPMAGGSSRGHEEDDDEWGMYGADSQHSSAHTPVPIRSSRRTPLSARSGARGRNFRTPLGSSMPFISINGPANTSGQSGEDIDDGFGDTSGVLHSEDYGDADGFQHYGY